MYSSFYNRFLDLDGEFLHIELRSVNNEISALTWHKIVFTEETFWPFSNVKIVRPTRTVDNLILEMMFQKITTIYTYTYSTYSSMLHNRS